MATDPWGAWDDPTRRRPKGMSAGMSYAPSSPPSLLSSSQGDGYPMPSTGGLEPLPSEGTLSGPTGPWTGPSMAPPSPPPSGPAYPVPQPTQPPGPNDMPGIDFNGRPIPSGTPVGVLSGSMGSWTGPSMAPPAGPISTGPTGPWTGPSTAPQVMARSAGVGADSPLVRDRILALLSRMG